MRRPAALVLSAAIALSSVIALHAASKEEDRLDEAGTVLDEILAVPDNIPQQILGKARCVVVIPSMVKVALGIGGNYGRGAMVCRTGADFTGAWGAPAMYALDGGSIGFQLGGSATDMVLLVMNTRGVKGLLENKVKLGAGATVAAGPKGRDVTAATDATMRAEVLSYSRSRGLFAGISLEGASLRPDNDASEKVYGRKITAKEIVTGDVAVPASGQKFVGTLQTRVPRATP